MYIQRDFLKEMKSCKKGASGKNKQTNETLEL
jgi:hypothetical protein